MDYLKALAEKACNKFGVKRQLVVAMEELNELSCAIAKFVRYDNKEEVVENTREKVLDEYCDVVIVMNTIAHVYGFTEDSIKPHLKAKADRLQRWVDSEDTSLKVSLKDRAVIEKQNCETCDNYINPDYGVCKACNMAQATEGIKPFYKKKG